MHRQVAVFGGVTIALLAVPIRDLVIAAQTGVLSDYLGVDYRLYIEATRAWLATGIFYPAYQLAGPYGIAPGDILYPPNALPFFAVASVLPAAAWWAIPLGIVAWCVWHHRPSPILWPFIAICLAWPPTSLTIAVGNPAMWVAASVGLGTVYGWPSVFVLLKPQLAPFALIGIRRRSWWIALAVLCLVSLAFLPMWSDWVTVVLNSRGGGLLYSVQQVPLLLVPVIAALPVAVTPGRQQTPGPQHGHGSMIEGVP